MDKSNTVEIGKLLTEKIKALLGPNVKETKGSGNQKGDLDLHYNIPSDKTVNRHLVKLWIEAKNKRNQANAIIDRKEFNKANKQASAYGALPVYVTTDKDGEVYCAMAAIHFRIILELLDTLTDSKQFKDLS